MRARPTYCEVYMPIDRLARGPWELRIGWQAPRVAHIAVSLQLGQCACQVIPASHGPRAKRSVSVYTSQ